ncbi:MAG: helix-turn-helix domain-containing protein [Alphaproteobacteria bacterium]|nr:helix-turn-helix domain-containing protein [Alphaproteobacteria bacterium]
MDDKIFTPKQLAKYLETSVSALSQYRALGIGPVYLKIGRMVRYRLSDVDEWLRQKASRKN